MPRPRLLSKTQSLCPICLTRIPAARRLENDTLYLEKNCATHGKFKTKIWQGEKSFRQWVKPKIPIKNRFEMVPENKGCPFDCGLCPHHLQHTCTAVLEVTQNCNFNCCFCFAESNPTTAEQDPGLDKIFALMAKVYATSPGCNLQISGGEPTLRTDLPEIITHARKIGFEFVQLNTNGFLLATDKPLAGRLADAGLSSVFLQFDGTSDTVHKQLRGRSLSKIKEKAVSRCSENNIGVVLVPTLVPGINIQQIGPILSFALDHAPLVRGVHFQPVSYFGRHTGMPKDEDRITIPEILCEIESQTQGMFQQKNFRPSACEHALCSFNGKFLINKEGRPTPLTPACTDCCKPVLAEQGSQQAKASVARHWQAPGNIQPPESMAAEDGLDRFIRQAATHMFSVSGMAFQDAWNLDLDRLKGCCIHSVAPDGRLIPFCAYNLTSGLGKGLYRKT